jgi:dTDP-4-dehydrorhamnose reductase
MTRFLITGATGLLGPYLKEASKSIAETVVSSRTGGDYPCDLSDPAATRELIAATRPNVVFHCAAMTNVDVCELEPEKAKTLNCDIARILTDELPDEVVLTYFSTDQVYPDEPGLHREPDSGPVNVYGGTKLDGEIPVLERASGLVLRVNFFGPSLTAGRKSLSDWLIENLRARKPISLYTDSLFSPLHLGTLSQLAIEAATSRLNGIYNLGCRDGASKCDFALAMAAHLKLPTGTASPALSSTIADRAHRAKDLRMNVEKIEQALQRPMPTLLEEVARL